MKDATDPGHLPDTDSTTARPAPPADGASDAPDTSRPAPDADERPVEIGGQKGPEPTRYGDWEKKGRCTDF